MSETRPPITAGPIERAFRAFRFAASIRPGAGRFSAARELALCAWTDVARIAGIPTSPSRGGGIMRPFSVRVSEEIMCQTRDRAWLRVQAEQVREAERGGESAATPP